MNASTLEVRYASYRLDKAQTAEDRAKWADRLASHGEPGLNKLLELIREGRSECCQAAASVIERVLNDLPKSDPRSSELSSHVLEIVRQQPKPPNLSEDVILGLVQTILKNADETRASACRPVIAAGLKAREPAHQLLSVQLAMHPLIRMRSQIAPLLTSSHSEVRRAALFAIAPASDEELVIADEELFHWLHDSDEGVRRICYNSLVSRGRTELEVRLGRKLSDPAVSGRLELLHDLSHDDEIADPEPWLERLSRDSEPAVRAGAARVAVEAAIIRRLTVPVWAKRVADTDQDPTVRKVAGFYGLQSARIREEVRPVQGP
jgi:hypothetical protein